jgi:hypothetical protein
MQILDREKIERNILVFAKNCRIFSTEHISRWFQDYSRPNQKALEYIKPLVDQKLLETKEQVTGGRGFENHLFRLTKKGREKLGVDYHPIPFTNSRVPHWLLLGHVYLDMSEVEDPYLFLPEQRLNDKKFYPDIFTIWQSRAMWIEVQKSPLTSSQWAKKWARYNEYIDNGYYRFESWQREKKIKPRIVAISTQMHETILTGNNHPIDIVQNIREMVNIFETSPV